MALIAGSCGPLSESSLTDETGGWAEAGTSVFDFNCGVRTVTAAPASTFIKVDFSLTTTVSPTDSPLARALFGEHPGQDVLLGGIVGDSTLKSLEEVDGGGNIVATYTLMEISGRKVFTKTAAGQYEYRTRYVAHRGCLARDIEVLDPQNPPSTLPTTQPTDLPEIPPNPCGPGQIALGHNGLSPTASEPHICLQVGFRGGCVDCWFADGTWHQKTTYTGVYVALESLESVTVRPARNAADAAGGTMQTVNIQQGDRVEYTYTMESTYSISPSPAELGYEELLSTDGTRDQSDFGIVQRCWSWQEDPADLHCMD